MTVKFRLEYATVYGEELLLVIDGARPKMEPMRYIGGNIWECTFKTAATTRTLHYHYELHRDGAPIRKEWGKGHTLTTDKGVTAIALYDRWHDMPSDRSFRSSMFTEGVFARPKTKKATPLSADEVMIRAEIPVVRSTQQVVLVGDQKVLGNWEVKKGVVMSDSEAPVWTAHIPREKLSTPFTYKFVIVDTASGETVAWEAGENNFFDRPLKEGECVVIDSLRPRFHMNPWRGAGVAIPVFALRSNDSFGVGEFNDLKLMIDWAASTGQSIIQILPVNDTTMTGTWQDSYPYNANSTFALHPQFLHLPDVGKLKDAS